MDEIIDNEQQAVEGAESPVEDVEATVDAGSVAEAREPDHVDGRSSYDRTAELLNRMPGRRGVLLKVLAHCVEPKASEAVDAFIDGLQSTNKSVYTAASLCSLLEETGALVRQTESGEPYVEVEPEPRTVVVDGVEYYEAPSAPVLFWRTTEAGVAICERDDPFGRLRAMLSEEGEQMYLPIYERILTMCLNDGGATTPELSKAVDKDPLVQSPRCFVQRFIERLERCDALAWDGGAWSATELGVQAFDELAAIEM